MLNNWQGSYFWLGDGSIEYKYTVSAIKLL